MRRFLVSSSMTARVRRVVAVDARPLTQTGKGVPRFLAETLRELVRYDELKFILFSNRELHPDHSLPIQTEIDSSWHGIPGSLWMMARFNKLALRHGADTVWGPAHVLPAPHKDLHSVLTVHDLVHRIMPESMGLWNRCISKLMVDRSIRQADQIIADSEATKTDILSLNLLGRKDIEVIYLGRSVLQSHKIKSATTAHSSSNKYLFAMGSIEPRKNISGLLKCFERLQIKCPDLILRLTGAHTWGSSSELKAIERNDACQMLGYLSDAELSEQLTNAKAFIMPSHYEGFGLPIIEAVGLAPIIASDIPVFRELGKYIEGICYVDFAHSELAVKSILDFLAADPVPARFVNGGDEIFRWRTTANRYAEIFLSTRSEVKK